MIPVGGPFPPQVVETRMQPLTGHAEADRLERALLHIEAETLVLYCRDQLGNGLRFSGGGG